MRGIGGSGDFVGGTGSLTTFNTVGIYYETGRISVTTNNELEKVLEFVSTQNNDEDWWIQVLKDVSLAPGFSYQILVQGYDYGKTLFVPIGIADYATESSVLFLGWETDKPSQTSAVLTNCETTIKGHLYINGGFEKGDGFAIKSIKIMKTPIACD